jgi:hypothetical protein
MATEDLTLLMRARGALRTKKDVDSVGRSVRDTGKDSKKSSRDVTIFTRALTLMTTRAGVAIIVIGALGALMPAIAPAVALLTAGLLALGAVLAPVILVGNGVMQRFKDTAGMAGSAASELTDVLAALKHAWAVAISPAAAIVMRGISNAFAILIPIIEQFKPVLTVFARAMAAALGAAAAGLAVLAPELEQLFGQSGQLLMPMVQIMLALSDAFIRAAIYGLPVALQLLDWLLAFSRSLPGAVDWMNRFAHSAGAINTVKTVFGLVAAVAVYVADVFSSLAGIAYQVWQDLLPLTKLLAGGLLLALRGVRDGLDWINRNFGALHLILTPLAASIAIYVAAVKTAAAATWAWGIATGVASNIGKAITALQWAIWWINLARAEGIAAAASLALNASLAVTRALIAFSLIGALALLVVGLIYAYKHSTAFRNIVQSIAHWVVVAATNVKNWLGGAFQWVADKAQALYNKVKPIVDIMRKIAGFTPMGIASKGVSAVAGKLGIHVPHLATGGLVTQGGAVRVGEKGAETVHLGAGDLVEPNGGWPSGPSEEWVAVPVQFAVDGEVLARGVARASRRKKSVR